uniref:Uncharacterized protein n=1 Tax=Vitis vinifera TaxID=29760 RepID=A5BMW6_VITVI|nr:hypothetical protein VITISV_024160 [Vitis vinifera]
MANEGALALELEAFIPWRGYKLRDSKSDGCQRPSGDRCLLMKVGYTKGENADQDLQELINKIDQSPDAENELEKAMGIEAFSIFTDKVKDVSCTQPTLFCGETFLYCCTGFLDFNMAVSKSWYHKWDNCAAVFDLLKKHSHSIKMFDNLNIR